MARERTPLRFHSTPPAPSIDQVMKYIQAGEDGSRPSDATATDADPRISESSEVAQHEPAEPTAPKRVAKRASEKATTKVTNDSPPITAPTPSLRAAEEAPRRTLDVATASLPAIPLRATSGTPPSEPLRVFQSPSFHRAPRAIKERRARDPRRRSTIYFDIDVTMGLHNLVVKSNTEFSLVVNAIAKRFLVEPAVLEWFASDSKDIGEILSELASHPQR